MKTSTSLNHSLPLAWLSKAGWFVMAVALLAIISVPIRADLVAHWTFDEVSGTAAHDSASGLHGTLSPSGADFVSGGISSNAVSISRAANGFVNMGNVLSLTSGDFSVVAWIKMNPGDTTPDTIILGKHEAGYVNGYLLLVNQSGGGGQDNKALFYAGGLAAEGPVSKTSVNDGSWHQVAGVYKSGTDKVIYVDGLAEATNSGPAINGNTSAFLIGGLNESGVPASRFTGLIDDVQVYNRALGSSDIFYLFENPGKVFQAPPFIAGQPKNQTLGVGGTATFTVVADGEPPLSYQWQHETTNLAGATGASLVLSNVQPSDAGIYAVRVTNAVGSVLSSNALLTVSALTNCVPPPSGLVSWWRAEGNTLDGADGNSGALAGNTMFGAGKVGQAFSFDGNGDGVLLGKPANLELQDFTIEAWIKRASTSLVSSGSGVDAAFISYGTGGYGFGLDRLGGHPFLSKIGIDSLTPTANVLIADTNFHHLAVTKSGTSVVFYLDGVAYPAPSYSSTFTFSTSVALGARGDNLGNSFLGIVDELAFYNRALASNEIAAIFAASGDGKCPILTPFMVRQPADQAVPVGGTATFSVVAGGAPPFSYQWQHGTTNLAGATGASLVLTNVRTTDAGTYFVRVTNALGSATSSNALLTVPPVGLLWSTNLGASLFAVDEQTNTYANVGGAVITLNGAGVPLQTNTICPRPGSARRDVAGNYYFAGFLPSHVPSGGIFRVVDPQDFGGVVLSNFPVFLAKYSAAGNLLWATNFGPTGSFRGFDSIDLALDGAGSVFVSYSFHSSTIDHDAQITKCDSTGAVIWTAGLPKPLGGNGAFGYARLGALSPTNGFGVHFTSVSGSFYAVALSTFDANGATAIVTSWNQNNSSAHLGTRPIRNSLGQIYNVEQGGVLTKRTTAGALIWTNNTGSLKWAVGQDKWDGVHLADSSGPLVRYDYDGNSVWSLQLPSQVVCMELDTNGNRFISTLNGIVARISDEQLAAPIITNGPVGTTVFTGTNVTLTVGAAGTTPLRYYWFNGTNAVAGATNATLALVNPTSSQSGSYSVIVSNFLGSVASTPVQVRIKAVQLYNGNQMLTNGTYVLPSPPTLTVRSAFTNGSVFYTLDGSTPSFASTPYAGPFTVSSNATVRALGYSADFLQSEEADAVNLVLPPTYTLTVGTVGPGSVGLNPTGGVYLASTVVTVTATPAEGWVFHHWSGDASGTGSSIDVVMTQDWNIQAVFATRLSTTVAGNGQVQPAGGVYPYGSVVRLSAIPQPGNYFGVWGNAASGNSNPLYFPITNANPTVSSLFAALPQGQSALTVLIHGPGSINVNPPGNIFATNQSVTLTATPYAGQGFIDWSGDASGTENPLTVAMTQSRVITANFTNWPVLVANQQSFTPEGFRFSLLSGPGLTYQVQGSTNLSSWVNLGTVTNATGETQFTDPTGTNLPLRFYRATSWP